MGRIDRQARVWLAEILYGLLTGNYRRVAEIHFEAQYVPPHHSIEEFATALRAVGEPMRGMAAKDVSLGQMLDGLFKITRDFDMPTQPHLLLLQKTMVMEEGVATALDPDINMWETAEPFLTEWVRSELGPEARIADEIVRTVRTLRRLPEIIRRIDHYYPPPGAAPLLQTFFSHMRDAIRAPAFAGTRASWEFVDPGVARFELSLVLHESAERLHGFLEYDRGLFSAESAAALAADYSHLLTAAVAKPEQRLTQLHEVCTPRAPRP